MKTASIELKGHWNLVKGMAKKRWEKLTDSDLRHIDGKRDRLVSRLEKLYGWSHDEADGEVDSFEQMQMPAQEQATRM